MTWFHSPLGYVIRNGQRVQEAPLPNDDKIVRLADEDQQHFDVPRVTIGLPVPGVKHLIQAEEAAVAKKAEEKGAFYPVRTIEQATEALLIMLGVYHYGDMDSHMAKTPQRFAAMLKELTTPVEFNFTTFPAESDEMITLGPIPFYTMCAHHIIPFYGQAFIGYVPDKLIAGLSKFARLVDAAAKGVWVQESLTGVIANLIEQHLSPRGVAVILEGEHMCMSMRGAKTPNVITTTSAMRGVFGDHDRTAKAEFMQIIAPRRKNNG